MSNRIRHTCRLSLVLATVVVSTLLIAAVPHEQATEIVTLRGHPQSVRLYGTRGGTPVVVSSGDGGWIHLAPHVADVLAARGCFVVGFDVKAYLESFTSGKTTIRPEDEPGDFQLLAQFAARGSTVKPVLVGVSEGAGLSVLAATDAKTKALISGVIGLGLPNLNELGWRWKDSLIYITHGVPNEPTFSVAAIVRQVAPMPLVAIHSTHDEFVPLAEAQAVMAAASDPKKLWIIESANHGFTDNFVELDRRIIEALQWIAGSAPR